MADQATSPLIPLIKEGAGWVGEFASIVGIPGVGLAAKLIEKAPLGSFEAWLRHRSRGDQISVPEPPEPVRIDGTEAGTATIVEGRPENSPPQTVVVDVDELLKQYVTVQESEPFFAALNAAMKDAVVRLQSFLVQTSIVKGYLDKDTNGLWPAFALEWKVRRGLNDKLSAAATVNDVPALRSLLQAEFAAAMIDDIMASAADPGKPLALGKEVRLFAASEAYKWPKAEGFRSGYVVASVRKPDALRGLIGEVEPQFEPEKAAQIAASLTSRLGRLSVAGRDELTLAWLRTCAASELPPKLREKRGLAINPFLSRIEYPLLHVADPALLESIRPDVELIYGKFDGIAISSHRDFYDALNEIALAYAGNDPARFEAGTRKLKLNSMVPKFAPVRLPVENVIARLNDASD